MGRVHHIINSYSLHAGGAERLVRGLHLGLRRQGLDSRLLGIEHQADHEEEAAVSLGLPSAKSYKAFAGVRAYLKRECGPQDIVHAHLFPSNLYAGLLRKHCGAAMVTTEHNTHNRRRGTLLGSIIDRLIYPKCEQIVCISEGTQGAMLQWMPQLAARTTVITNGVDLPFAQYLKLDSNKERPLIVSVGNLREQKNYPKALEAIALLGDLDFEYHIAGEGADRKALEAYISAHGLAGKVRLLGHTQDVPQLLQHADLFFMPSMWEGFGMAAVEAMNAGLPVVASDIDGLGEVVDASCASLCDPSDASSMAGAIRNYLENPGLRSAHGRAGFQRSLEFSEQAMVDGYVELYSEMIKEVSKK
ncbi:glycosyltransferase family 4 protein [Rubritalea marina]|uniref:glycosyltransferase family 4 protein n=1 Tax=Rubritalea marina TaxID=361055 RepID=UPI00037F625E|nr:glycosyltransferase family 4 protein [Rubritalea marina]